MSEKEPKLNNSNSQDNEEDELPDPMMNFHIDDNIFASPDNDNKEEKVDEEKIPEQKNAKIAKRKKNKKGTDFLDYAKDKGIEFNIQYENIESTPYNDHKKQFYPYNPSNNNPKGKKAFQGQRSSSSNSQSNTIGDKGQQQQQPNAQQMQQQQNMPFNQGKVNKYDQVDTNKKIIQQKQRNPMMMMNNNVYDNDDRQGGDDEDEEGGDDGIGMNMANMQNNNYKMQQQQQQYMLQQQQQYMLQQQKQYYLQQQQQQKSQWNYQQYQPMHNSGRLLSTIIYLLSYENLSKDSLICSWIVNQEGFIPLSKLNTHPQLQMYSLSKELLIQLIMKFNCSDIELREGRDGQTYLRSSALMINSLSMTSMSMKQSMQQDNNNNQQDPMMMMNYMKGKSPYQFNQSQGQGQGYMQQPKPPQQNQMVYKGPFGQQY